MAEVYPINTTDFQAVNYSPQDQNLILQTEITTDLPPTSCIELYIYDLKQNQLGIDYNFKNYIFKKTKI